MNRRPARHLFAGALTALALLAPPARAQPAPGPAPAAPEEPPAEEPAPPPEPPAAPRTGTVTGIVESPDLDAPVVGASVTVMGTSITAISDGEGRYSLEVPPGKYRLRVEITGFRPAEREVTIAAGATVEQGFPLTPDQVMNEVIVIVGARTPRTNVETTVPVDVVSAQDITGSGRTETGRALTALVPSYVSTPQTIADGSDHIDPASLRGLGPDQVLVLINGKRRHRTALMHVNGTFGRGTVGSDLNAIPAASIKRIEVLRDGAASQYGSDAIAGVINIVTKDITDVVDVSLLSGITSSGDGAQVKAAANYGFRIGDKGFLNLTGEFLRRDATNRTGAFTGTVFEATDRARDDERLAEVGRRREDFEMQIGEAAATSGLGAYTLELPLGPRARFYSFGDASFRRGLAAGFYRFPKQLTQNVPEFYPLGFLPRIGSSISDQAITAGVRRSGTWDVDASLTYGRNAFDFTIENSVNASLGTRSPTTFDAGGLRFAQTVGNIDLLHKVDTSLVKSLNLVLGSELRVEEYQIRAGEEASYVLGPERVGATPKAPGSQVFPGFQPSNEVSRRRDSIGVYAGVESQPTKEITLDLGGRFEQYSDFGNSLIGKAAVRVEPVKGYAVRGAASTGFRAPSLQQLWFSNVSTLFLTDPVTNTLQPFQVLTSNNASPITRAFGVPALKEERSVNASAGFTIRPLANVSLTADAYLVRIADRIVLTSQFSGNANPDVAAILQPFPGVTQAQFFANAIDTKTQGLDVVVDYTLDLRAAGTLALTGSANFSKTVVTDVNIPATLVNRFSDAQQLRTFYFGRQAENRIEDSVPRQRGTGAARWTRKQLTALGRASYYGPVFLRPDNAANDERFGGKVLFDAELSYQVTKNLALTAGGQNLLNTYPDELTKEANQSEGRFVYPRNTSQFGQNGAFYYGRLELTFF
jgi:iron complex outermembrane receptor protein